MTKLEHIPMKTSHSSDLQQEDIEVEYVSRTQKKKECAAINEFSKKLAGLTLTQVARLDADDDIKEEILIAIKTKTMKAKARQTKYLGGYLRRLEDSKEVVGSLRKQLGVDR